MPIEAGEERVDYDALGRLMRVVDEQGRATIYTYDPAGNLLRVSTSEADQAPPVVMSVSPDFVRVGGSRQLRITGAGLLSAVVSTADAELDARVIAASPNELTIHLTASTDAALGPRAITISNTAGSTEAAVNVRPALTFTTVPSQMVVPPDSVARPLTLRMSDSNPEDVTLTLSIANPALVSVSPGSIVLSGGQTDAQLTIIGAQAGQTYLDVSSVVLTGTARLHVIVANDALARSAPLGVFIQAGASNNLINNLVGPDLGVFVSQPSYQAVNSLTGADVGVWLAPPDATQTVNNLTSSMLGVISGAPAITSLSPNTAIPGAAFTLLLNGINFFDATNVIAEPADGITFVSVPTVASDGLRVTVDVVVDPDAASGPRVVRVVTPRGTSSPVSNTGNTFTINVP